MRVESFILNIIKKIEGMKEGMFSYGYLTGNEPMTHVFWEISVSDYNFYMKDKRFRILSNAWMKAARARGIKLIFVCGWIPTEEKLVGLAENNQLILNV